MSEHGSLLRSTAVISLATLMSRILGLLRDSLIGAFLPKTLADAFVTAFRIPNTLRELFAEGALSAAFVPVFTEVHHKKGKEEADRLAGAVFRALFIVLLLICILGILLAPLIVMVFLLGRIKGPESDIIPITITLTRIMFPYLLLISLAAVNMGLLHSLKKFGVPACSPILLNLSMIGCLLAGAFWKKQSGFPLALYLSYGVLLGGFLQLFSQWLLTIQLGYLQKIKGPFWHPKSGEIIRLMLPRLLGVATTQFNMILNTIFASFLAAGSIFILWDANRLFQFPLGVLGIALSTAAFPQLAKDAAAGSLTEFHNTLRQSLQTMLTIMIPSTVGLIILGLPISDLLFNYGKFKEQGLLHPTYLALCAYSIGLAGHSGVKLVASGFYALKDTVTPVRISIISLFINALVSLIAMQFWGPAGLAFGTSISALFNFFYLSVCLRNRISGEFWNGLWGALGRIIISSSVMLVFLYFLVRLFPITADSPKMIQLILFSIVAVVSYFISIRHLLPEEYRILKGVFFRTGKK